MSRKQRKMLYRIIAAAVLWGAGFLLKHILNTEERFGIEGIILLAIFTASYIIIGWDVLWKAVRNISRGQVFDENFLMSIASIGAMIVGEYDEGCAVLLLYQVGELFQSVAVGRSRKSISDMMDINPEFANIERDGELVRVDPSEVSAGDIITVKPGERIPLDGEVIFGSSALNTSALTGESAPRDVTVGDEVISGCINTDGLLRIKVSRPYSDSTVAKILELVENSSENKAKTENFITRFARVYTPVVVIGAVLLAVVPSLFTGDWAGWIYKALTFLVVSCPCALVISVPLSYFGGIGGASKCGIMVKGANYLEALSRAQTYVFDKTGTITKGSFAVSEIHPAVGVTENSLLEMCAAAESGSNHPIALSIVNAAKQRGITPAAENAREIAGFGVEALVGGREVAVGNARFMKKLGADCPETESGGTLVHCAADGAYAGYIVISDEIKDGARSAIAELKKLGAAKTVMLTGDRKSTGEAVAAAVGIDEFHTELLPDGKVALVEKLYSDKPEKSTLVFVGDGMNDAPALARADVGIAMGALGSGAAIEAADIVLMNDNIENLPAAVKIARKTHAIVMENIIFAITVKVLIMALTAVGIGNMWAAVFADVGVAVIAIFNAMRAMNIRHAQ